MSSRWLADVLRGDRGRPGISSYSQLLSYFAANWAVTDWYLDAVNGSDSNNGTSAGSALKSPTELSNRLPVALPISHRVTVHVALGSYDGILAIRAILSQNQCSVDVVADIAITVLGPISSYIDRVVLNREASFLTVVGIADWTPYVNRMVQIVGGPSDGAVAWIAQANPKNGAGVPQGLATARCSSFSTVAANLGGTRVVPAAGSSVALVTMPSIRKVSLDVRGQLPSLFANTYLDRLALVRGLSVESVTMSGGRGLVVDACELGNVEFLQHRNTYAQSIVRSRIKGTTGLSIVEMGMADLQYVMVTGAPNSYFKLTDGRILYSLVQGAYLVLEQSQATDVGIFDNPAASGACQILSARSARSTISSIYGRDNAREGISINTASVFVASLNTVTGAAGDIRVNATVPYYLPYSALPYLDGQQSGSAVLVVPGVGHLAEATSYVDVTVKSMPLATQQMLVSYKTFAGVTGALCVKYIDPTTIRIVSSSSSDVSTVTWELVSVGDDVVMRS
jgi:hypothetical protein